MKFFSSFSFFVSFIAIIFSTIIAFAPHIEGHNIYIQNKLDRGTWASVAGTIKQEDNFNWNNNDAFAQDSSRSHAGFVLSVPDNVLSYWVILGVGLSAEEDKWRGPYNNTQDICWHFHGHLENWEIWPC
ncbi:hypothetical protein C2G38_2076483, partial [Gigaspora rosea]